MARSIVALSVTSAGMVVPLSRWLHTLGNVLLQGNLLARPWLSIPLAFVAVFDSPSVCWPHDAAEISTEIRLIEVTGDSGITFRHSDGSSGRRYVVEAMTAGLAIFDYDGDGLLDIYFVNGSHLPGSDSSSGPLTNALYKNLGNMRFVDVSAEACVADSGYGLGAVAGDFDNDGDEDLYVTNFGPNVMYVNNGDGTFSDLTAELGVSAGERFSAGAAFLDADGDGDLELYCGNYQQFKFEQHIVRMIAGHQFHPGPLDYPPQFDNLFRNNGDGTFVDVSQESGINAHRGTSMGILALDLDEDFDTDILIANDNKPNFEFVNDGTGKFTEEAVLSGLAYDRQGHTNGNMGLDVGDVDGDHLLDIITTTYQNEMPVLYKNLGGGFWQDATNVARIDNSLFPHVNWGVGLCDFDNDCDLDVFIACGHFMDNIQYIDDRTQMKVTNYLLENNGHGVFRNVTAGAGSGMQIVDSSRGAAFGDLDNDGDVDAVILNFNSTPNILRNDTNSHRHWLKVSLVGVQSNRSAAGARIRLTAGGMEQSRVVLCGRGYQSQYGSVAEFGLSESNEIENLNVTWPSGKVEEFVVNAADERVLLVEGHGQDGNN